MISSGGHGQFGHVYLRVEPKPTGGGFEFVNAVKGGNIPREYIPAVEKGVREALENGFLAGYPMVDVGVTLLDGSYHEVDSSEIAFKIAGSMAFKEAVSKAAPVLLEPIMAVEVVVPEEFMGEVIGDVSARRGKVLGIDSRPGNNGLPILGLGLQNYDGSVCGNAGLLSCLFRRAGWRVIHL